MLIQKENGETMTQILSDSSFFAYLLPMTRTAIFLTVKEVKMY